MFIYIGVKTAILNIKCYLMHLKTRIKRVFHWARSEFARSFLFARSEFVDIALADMMSNADKG